MTSTPADESSPSTHEERIAEIRAEIDLVRADVVALADPDAISREVVAVGPGAVPAEVARAQMASVRGRAMKESQKLAGLQSRLIAEIEAQARAAKAEVELMMAPLRAQMQVAAEKIWTIDLYLGRDEEIVSLLDGEPAPADTPITLRQAVLTMDEETAAYAADGGIDARNIEVFDEWVKDPEHLAQVFPEPKGVVVLVPRRRGRDYQDPWMNEAMRKENNWSYFLIRNGEKLFRMRTDFVVGKNLIPTTDEFTGLFTTSRYNHVTRETEIHELVPGTDEWDAAALHQDARQRHFMRMALVLQGLVDRTTVWHPLPPQGVNLLSNDTYENGTAVLLRDAEMVLTDGREEFYPWLTRLNAELRVGMRVMGAFHTSGFNDAGGHRDPSSDNGWRETANKRITPKKAQYPDTGTVYRLDGRKVLGSVEGFTFKYERTQKIYTRDDWGREVLRAPKSRATCAILPTDRFVLPYDLVTVEELRYYLASRRQRHAYEDMFPLLHAAVAAKEAEAIEESPFRVLLIGELIKADPSLSLDEATAKIDELVHWWKVGARFHRALNGDPAHESRAIKEIVSEHLARTGVVQAQSGDTAAEQAMVTKLLDHDPSIMVIGRKRDGSYLAFAPQPRSYPAGKVGYPATNVEQPPELTDEEQAALKPGIFEAPDKKNFLAPAAVADNVYAVEYATGKTGRTIKTRSWTQPGMRLDDTRILHANDAWAGWDIHAAANAHLTDTEIDTAIAEFLPEIESYAAQGWPTTRRVNGTDDAPVNPIILGVALRTTPGQYDPRPRFEVYLIDGDTPELDGLDAESQHQKIQYGKVEIPFVKTAKGVRLHRITDDNSDMDVPWSLRWNDKTYSHAPTDKPWHYFYGGRAQNAITLVTFPENGAVAITKKAAITKRNKALADLRDAAREPIRVVKRAWEARAEKEAYDRFIEDFADPDLWEGHKKTLHLESEIHPAGRGIPQALDVALTRFVRDERTLEGHTVRSVIEACGLELDDVNEDLLDLPVWEEPAAERLDELEGDGNWIDDDPDDVWNDD